MSRRYDRAARFAAVFGPPVAYALLALHYFARFLAHPTRGVPGGADGILYSWYFEWVRQSVVHLHNPFVSTYMNAPSGLNLMWNTALFLIAVLCIPLTATIGPIATVGFVMVFAPITSASTCYFVLRRLTHRSLTSALVATIYGFGPFFVGQQGHLHLSFAVFPPLLLLFGHQLFVEQTRSPKRTGLWFGIVLGLQLLIAEEVVVLAAVVAVFATLLLGLLHRDEVRARRHHATTGLGVAAGTAVVIAGIPLAIQFFGPHALHGIGLKGQRIDLAGLVRPSALQYFASDADIAANHGFPANSVENTGYLGWPLLILVLAIAIYYVRKHDRFGYWWLGTTAITVVLSLGSKITVDGVTLAPGPWLALRYLPLLGGVVVARFSLITTLLVVLLLARWLAGLHGRALGVGLLAVVAAMVPLLPSGPYDEISPTPTPRFFTTSAVKAIPPGATVYVMPYADESDVAAAVMLWQMKSHLRFRMIGGYSVFERNGKMTYHGLVPDYATLLEEAGRSGLLPTVAEIDAVRPSVQSSRTQFIVITGFVEHPDIAARAAQQLTGCTLRVLVDVTLCALPEGAPSR